MKKFVSVVLSSLVVLAFVAGCATAPAASAPAAAEAKPAEGKEVILLISAAGTLDDRAFNQGCYNGVKQFAAEFNKTYGFYQPTEDTVEAQVTMADTAVKGGAKFIIINSDQFKKSATIMVKNHPDVSFIIFDTIPVDDAGKQLDPLPKNILAILFREQQSTFLAGYAAVKDGYRKLGFMGGMPVPAVVRFGYGFVWGAEVACKELGLQGQVEMKYNYSGNFKPTPENQARAAPRSSMSLPAPWALPSLRLLSRTMVWSLVWTPINPANPRPSLLPPSRTFSGLPITPSSPGTKASSKVARL